MVDSKKSPNKWSYFRILTWVLEEGWRNPEDYVWVLSSSRPVLSCLEVTGIALGHGGTRTEGFSPWGRGWGWEWGWKSQREQERILTLSLSVFLSWRDARLRCYQSRPQTPIHDHFKGEFVYHPLATLSRTGTLDKLSDSTRAILLPLKGIRLNANKFLFPFDTLPFLGSFFFQTEYSRWMSTSFLFLDRPLEFYCRYRFWILNQKFLNLKSDFRPA